MKSILIYLLVPLFGILVLCSMTGCSTSGKIRPMRDCSRYVFISNDGTVDQTKALYECTDY